MQDCLHHIAETFNKEFEEVARLKQAEIARIREKNVRILKIVHQLQLEEELVQPTLFPEEQPEEMLTVHVRVNPGNMVLLTQVSLFCLYYRIVRFMLRNIFLLRKSKSKRRP